MENLLSVAMILSPMLLGFAIRLPKTALRLLDKALDGLVYAILWLIGIGLSQVDNLVGQLDDILFYSLLLFALTMACNLAVLMLFDRRLPFPLAPPKAACTASGTSGSFKQLLIVVAGIVYGIALPKHYLPPTQWSTYVLMLLMLVVGLQVRGNGITLRQILLNPRGIQIAVLFILSCLCAGCFFALLLPDVSLMQGMAMASGYGWYSLSGIVMTQAYGATWGSIALLNDLCREFFALVTIPMLMRRSPSAAVGAGGATSMDFTLPVLQHSGGIRIVPIAISFGFITNIASPLLMVFFSSWR